MVENMDNSPAKSIKKDSPEKEAEPEEQHNNKLKVREPTLKYPIVLQEDIKETLYYLRLKLMSNYTSLMDLQKIFAEHSDEN